MITTSESRKKPGPQANRRKADSTSIGPFPRAPPRSGVAEENWLRNCVIAMTILYVRPTNWGSSKSTEFRLQSLLTSPRPTLWATKREPRFLGKLKEICAHYLLIAFIHAGRRQMINTLTAKWVTPDLLDTGYLVIYALKHRASSCTYWGSDFFIGCEGSLGIGWPVYCRASSAASDEIHLHGRICIENWTCMRDISARASLACY